MATTEKRKKNTFFPYTPYRVDCRPIMSVALGVWRRQSCWELIRHFWVSLKKKRGFLLSNCIQRKRRVGQKRHKKRENPSGWNITDVSALAGVRPFGLFLFAPGPPRVRFFLSPINNLMTRPQTSSTPFNFFLSSFFFCFLAKFMNSKLTIVSFDLRRWPCRID